MTRLKELRQKYKYTQAYVSEHIGITRAAYTNIENGKRQPDYNTIKKLAALFSVTSDYLLEMDDTNPIEHMRPSTGVLVPVLGNVVAGIPLEAIEDILDYEEISKAMASQGEHFALKIKGNSMEPKISEGDVVIVRKQSDVNSGDIAVVLVNGDEATVKRIKKRPEGLMLIPSNTNFEPMFYTNEDIAKLPVVILGRVVELRAKF